MRLLQRSGSLDVECAQGDPYVMDQRVTRGHTQGITGGVWSSTCDSRFYTSGLDGTVRTWDTERCQGKNEQVLVVSKVVAQGASRSTHHGAVTCLCLSSSTSGELVFTGLRDGSVKAFNPMQPSRAMFLVKCEESAASCVAVNPFDDTVLGVRIANQVLLYDVRNTKSCLHKVQSDVVDSDEALGSNFAFTSASTLLFGVCERTARRENEKLLIEFSGKAQLWDFTTGDVVQEWAFADKGVTQVAYQAKLDQILLGHSDGSLTGVYRADAREQKGIIKALAKDPPKKEAVMDTSHLVATPEPAPYLTNLVGPEELDHLVKKPSSAMGAKEAVVETPRKALEGRIAQSSITQRILLQHVPVIGRDEDPREALLKVAGLAESDPKYVTLAYQQTEDINDEEEDIGASRKKAKQH